MSIKLKRRNKRCSNALTQVIQNNRTVKKQYAVNVINMYCLYYHSGKKQWMHVIPGESAKTRSFYSVITIPPCFKTVSRQPINLSDISVLRIMLLPEGKVYC